MYLSRLRIKNFRNFSDLDVVLNGNILVVGENRVGKSNMLHALRLILDPSLPDSARQLSRSDFWDGLDEPGEDDKIEVVVEISDFEADLDILAILTDFRLDGDPSTVRLTYEFRPKPGMEHGPGNDNDYDFICYGGESETKRFGHDLRRRITMDLLPALRDAEGDLATWRRSPLRPLLEEVFGGIDDEDLEEIKTAIEDATAQLGEFESVETLENNIRSRFAAISGPKQDIKPSLGFSPTEIAQLYRSIRLLIDDGKRGINDASLGSANIIFLALKALEVERLIEGNHRDHTLLCIEEPEAHLHPHLQRNIYRHFFETAAGAEDSPLSILLTSHSPHIASVAPLRSILVLRETEEHGTEGHSAADIEISPAEEEDLSRYLDVTRAEMLFARGVILVEGDAEKFLFPVFANAIGVSLDHLGITICSVSGTNFQPYAKFLQTLESPFSVVTDWDPRPGDRSPLGIRRALELVRTIQTIKTGEEPEDLIAELRRLARADVDRFSARCDAHGVFTNVHTLEVDLFNDEDFTEHIIETLREHPFSEARRAWIDAWEANPEELDVENYLKLIEIIGKGRFAQRLASRVNGIIPPDYIRGAIEFVSNRV